jgi:3-oxoacyl-[acyl-carrier protein] reductase
MAFNADDVVVVTGGARGIGLALSRHIAAQGATVAMLDLLEPDLRAAEAEIRAAGARAHGFVADVSNAAALQAVADRIDASIGPVVGLVTCAGTTSAAPSETMSREVWRKVLDINLDGTFYSCQAFGRLMLARRKGAIVTISSVSGLGGQSGRANYVASKWAVIGITKTLAIEWGARGVRVNCIAPGPINTALFQKLPAQFRDTVVLSRTPIARTAEPEEVAKAVSFLLSDDASFVTGSVLSVDGGYSSGYSTHQSGNDLAS